MLMLIYSDNTGLDSKEDLNTSNVNVNPLLLVAPGLILFHLNTSNVNVNRILNYQNYIKYLYLNTSNVNVNRFI